MARRVCWIQVFLGFVAAILIWIEEETLLLTGPTLTFFGFLIAGVSVRKMSWSLLAFGLFTPLFTSLIAAMIAAFSMGPNQAKYYLWYLIPLNAFALLGLALNIEYSRSVDLTKNDSIRFGLVHIMGLMTVICLLLSVFRGLATTNDNGIFAGYCTVVLAVSAIFVVMFIRKTKAAVVMT